MITTQTSLINLLIKGRGLERESISSKKRCLPINLNNPPIESASSHE